MKETDKANGKAADKAQGAAREEKGAKGTADKVAATAQGKPREDKEAKPEKAADKPREEKGAKPDKAAATAAGKATGAAQGKGRKGGAKKGQGGLAIAKAPPRGSYEGVLLRAIQSKCLDCSNNIREEVAKCPIQDCPLHPFRMTIAQAELFARQQAKRKGRQE